MSLGSTRLIACFVCLFSLFNFTSAFASEPSFYGAYLGELPYDKNKLDWIGYPQNYGATAGVVYLYKNKISNIEFISNSKTNAIKRAKKEAMKYAKENGKASYAITHLSYQIIRTESTTELYADFYIIVW